MVPPGSVLQRNTVLVFEVYHSAATHTSLYSFVHYHLALVRIWVLINWEDGHIERAAPDGNVREGIHGGCRVEHLQRHGISASIYHGIGDRCRAIVIRTGNRFNSVARLQLNNTSRVFLLNLICHLVTHVEER